MALYMTLNLVTFFSIFFFSMASSAVWSMSTHLEWVWLCLNLTRLMRTSFRKLGSLMMSSISIFALTLLS